MDISKLTEGEPLYKRKDVKASKSLIAQYKFTKGYENEIDVEEHVSNIFKNLTTEGIEHAFSTPDGKFMAHVDQLSVRGNPIHGHIECGLDVSWTDKKGNSVGSTSRSVFRDKNGHLHVYNDSMELNSKYQSKGLAQHEQERTEQLWRYLSDGHPVHLSLDANISVGVYAWAMKGYDFEDEDELANAKQEFSTFCNKNGLDIKETLHNCGYESIDSLQHSWQFASLDDGNPYKLADIEANPHEGVKKHLSGHLGKMFMLGGKQYWGAEKILNGGTEHESIAQEHKKSTKKGGK
jgi:hypothetical protein